MEQTGKIELIALDIDGTLVDPKDNLLSDENRRAIKQAQQAGVKVTLATGRIYSAMQHWVDELCIDIPVISSNGADVRQGHKPIERHILKDEAVRGAVALLDSLGMRVYLFYGATVYCTKESVDWELFAKWGITDYTQEESPVKVLDTMEEVLESTANNVQKMLIWADDATGHSKAWEQLSRLGGEISLVSGEALNLEINAPGVSKAGALQKIAEQYGIPMERVMAVGDSGNDVEMLSVAGISVAMANAMPEAKAAAAFEVASCRDNGVARAIERFVLID